MIEVKSLLRKPEQYRDADKFAVDEQGKLRVFRGSTIVAIYNHACWNSAEVIDGDS